MNINDFTQSETLSNVGNSGSFSFEKNHLFELKLLAMNIDPFRLDQISNDEHVLLKKYQLDDTLYDPHLFTKKLLLLIDQLESDIKLHES